MKLVGVLSLAFLSCMVSAEEVISCEEEEANDCSKCYTLLVSQIIYQDKNLFNVTSAFFPPDDESPVFVTVYYHYKNDFVETSNASQIWFWTTSTFYLFQPLHVFQFTSLFFSDTSLQSSSLHLTLPSNCSNASEEHMMLLTQRVSSKL